MAEKLKQTIEFQAKGIQKLKGQYKDLERRTRGLEGSTKGASGAMGGMIAKLGLTTVALYGASRAISAVVRVGSTFEKTMSNVAAISGATGSELKALQENAKQLGSTTVFTASQVAELQVEFAKLGFSSSQITGVTKDTLALASATGSELSTAAAIAGQTLRAFGLDVGQMSRVTDTMAQSFSSSALDMEKFTNSMTYVAPVAKSVGFSVEGTTAILGGLANAGISGSMAGTALRTVFLKLADGNSDLSKALGGSVTSADELLPALKKLKDGGVDLTAMLELVDKRAISAFDVLLNNTQTVADLKTELDNAAGAAQDMAEIQLANFEGKVTLLNSAMEGLGITLFSFVNEPLTDLVEGFTDFINNIDEQKINKFASAVGGLSIAIGGYNAAVLLAKTRTINFQLALARTGWGALIVGAGLAIGKILEVSDAFGIMEEEAVDAKKAIDSLEESTMKAFKDDYASKQAELAEKYEQGAKGAEKYALGLQVIAMASSQNMAVEKNRIALQDTINAMVEKGYLKLKEVKDKEVELTKSEQATYKSYQKERKTLFQEGTQDQLDALIDQTNKLTEIYEKQGKDVNEVVEFYDKKRAEILQSEKAVTFADDFNQAELAIYQQYLSQKQSITTLSRSEEESALDAQHTKLKEMLSGQGDELIALEKFVADSKEAIALKHHNNMMGVYSQLASGFGAFLGEFAGGQKASARLAQVSATIDTLAAANTALKTVQPYPLNIAAAAAIYAKGIANVHQISKSIGEFKNAETGYSGVVDKPTMFMTGENNKAEQVSITPLESPNIAGAEGGGGITINVSAPLVDESIIDSILPAIARAQQMELA